MLRPQCKLKMYVLELYIFVLLMSQAVWSAYTHVGSSISIQPLIEKFAWKSLDFEFPDELSRRTAVANGDYIPQNNLPVGIAVWHDLMFITVPRWRKGIPSSLNYIDLNTNKVSPKLNPYPDWAYNKEGNCDGITTTYRVRVDKCDRLWVLDSGTLGIDETVQQLCPYAVHVFDLRTNHRIRKYDFKPKDTNDKTFIANIVVDVGDSCNDTFMYASDELGYGLIVYSFNDDDSWRFEHSYFLPDPLAGDFNIAGLNFQWGTEGIFGLAVSPIQNGVRALLFHPLASYRTFYVSTNVLRNKLRVNDSYHEYHYFPERGPGGHITSHVMNDDGILFFNLIDQNAVGCWDSRKPYRKENLGIIAKNEKLIFPSDLYIDKDEILWVINDQMPVHLLSTLNFENINFRVFFNSVYNLISGTVCDPLK